MTQTVAAVYDTYDSAVTAVNALEAAGIRHSDISIVSNNVDNQYGKDRPAEAAKDAGKGAGVGAVVGGVGGLLTGLGLLAIPGVGPVVAAGWLVATAAGAATGAVVGGAAGGLVGSLTGAGVPEHAAHFYAEGVRRGGTLVTARVEDARRRLSCSRPRRGGRIRRTAFGLWKPAKSSRGVWKGRSELFLTSHDREFVSGTSAPL
jgi:uncharacterized protein YqgC (DUF456 family)